MDRKTSWDSVGAREKAVAAIKELAPSSVGWSCVPVSEAVTQAIAALDNAMTVSYEVGRNSVLAVAK